MTQQNVERFAALLEEKGYQGAMKLIMEDLIPMARKHKISLHAAAKKYADCDQEENTSWYRLGIALNKIKKGELSELGADKPFTKINIARRI